MTVVDANVVAEVIRATGGPPDHAISQAVSPLAVPELLDLELASTYRKLVEGGMLTHAEGRELLDRLRALPIENWRAGWRGIVDVFRTRAAPLRLVQTCSTMPSAPWRMTRPASNKARRPSGSWSAITYQPCHIRGQ